MEISVAEAIKDILLMQGSVVVPGLGAFNGSHKVSQIDSVAGVMQPSSLQIDFDPNSVINDGFLVDFIQKKYDLGIIESQKLVQDFTEKIKITLEKHEHFAIPDVGKLYRDHIERIQFMPTSANLNLESFGLPTLNFSPLSRTRPEVKVTEETHILTAQVPPMTPLTALPEPIPAHIQPVPVEYEDDEMAFLPFPIKKLIPALAVALLFILGFMIYIFNRDNKNTEGVLNRREPEVKINKSPKEQPIVQNESPRKSTQSTDNQAVKPTESKITDKEVFSESKKSTSEQETDVKPVVPPTVEIQPGSAGQGSKKATVILGGFADPANIGRHKKWLASKNFGLYEKKTATMTILGAMVSYNDDAELSEMVEDIRARFGNGISVKKQK